jgi:hypothetical protein
MLILNQVRFHKTFIVVFYLINRMYFILFIVYIVVEFHKATGSGFSDLCTFLRDNDKNVKVNNINRFGGLKPYQVGDDIKWTLPDNYDKLITGTLLCYQFIKDLI